MSADHMEPEPIPFGACPTCGTITVSAEITEGRSFLGIPIPTSEEIDNDAKYEGLLLLEPRASFDKCIVGVMRRFNDRFVFYDQKCVIDTLYADFEKDGSEDPGLDATEWFNFNTVGGWVGEHTPGFLEDPGEDE